MISIFFWQPVAGFAMLSCNLRRRQRGRRGEFESQKWQQSAFIPRKEGPKRPFPEEKNHREKPSSPDDGLCSCEPHARYKTTSSHEPNAFTSVFFFRAQFFRGPDGAREKAKRKCAQNLPLFCKIFAVKRGRKPPQRKRKTRAFILEKTKHSTICANNTRTRERSIRVLSIRIRAKNRKRIALHICLPS